MNTKFALAVFSATLFILAAAAVWEAIRSERRAGAALAEIAARRSALDGVIRRDRERIEADTRAGRDFTLRAAPAPAAASAPSAGRAKASASSEVAAMLESNPALFALGVRAYQANLSPHYRALYRALNLAPAQIEAFENLMTEHEEALLDLGATAAAQGLADADPAVLAVRQQEEDQLRAGQIALLGEPGYRQLQQLGRVEPVEEIVANVAATVALTPAPLSSAQAAELTDFLANASSGYRNGASADPATIDWDVALPQARAILTAEQLSALKAEALKPQLEKLQSQLSQPPPTR